MLHRNKNLEKQQDMIGTQIVLSEDNCHRYSYFSLPLIQTRVLHLSYTDASKSMPLPLLVTLSMLSFL